MGGVEEREGALLTCLGRGVVAQVRGEERVDARGAHVGEEAVAGAAADGHRADRRVEVARDADALRGGGQPVGGQAHEFAQGDGVFEFADPAESAAARGVGRVRYEGAGDAEVEGARERVGDARVGTVGVGVRDVQSDIVLDQRVDDAALEGGGGDGRRAAQIERVVRDQQVRAQLHRLVDGLLDGVHGEQDPGDLRVGVAGDGADRVPRLGPLGGHSFSSAAMTSGRRGTVKGYLPSMPRRPWRTFGCGRGRYGLTYRYRPRTVGYLAWCTADYLTR